MAVAATRGGTQRNIATHKSRQLADTNESSGQLRTTSVLAHLTAALVTITFTSSLRIVNSTLKVSNAEHNITCKNNYAAAYSILHVVRKKVFLLPKT